MYDANVANDDMILESLCFTQDNQPCTTDNHACNLSVTLRNAITYMVVRAYVHFQLLPALLSSNSIVMQQMSYINMHSF